MRRVVNTSLGYPQEMFAGYSTVADVAVVINLLQQAIDCDGDLNEATVNERKGLDWNAEDILNYLMEKYADELKAYWGSNPVTSF